MLSTPTATCEMARTVAAASSRSESTGSVVDVISASHPTDSASNEDTGMAVECRHMTT
jgi:hypothetical protein